MAGFSDYSSWEEIEEELKKEGFELDGIDEDCLFRTLRGYPVIAVIGITSTHSNYLKHYWNRVFWTTTIYTKCLKPISK